MRNKNYNTHPLLFVFSLVAWTSIFSQSADIILTNGKIFTSDTTQLYVQALAIKGNKILAAGSSDDMKRFTSSKTIKINLEEKTVVPGFNEAHDHLGSNEFTHVGQMYSAPFSIEGPDKKSVLDSVARLVKLAKPNQWITGPIGVPLLLDTGLRASLDIITPNNPVALGLPWGQGTVANSKALQLAGIPETAPDFLGAWYIRHPRTNKITGMYEYAQWPIWNVYCTSEPENYIKGLQGYSLEQIKHGITTVQHMNNACKPKDLYVFTKAKLSQRIRIIPYVATTLKGRTMQEWENVNPHLTDLVYISGVKYLADGSPLEQLALMKTPYPGTSNWYGRLNIPADTIKNILHEALISKRQLMLHIVGDSTMTIVLPLMKQMASPEVWRSKRVRFEHNSTSKATLEEINTIKNLGILMMHTPKYERGSHIRSFFEKGITVGISSDGTSNPFNEITIITTQQDDPNENITREQAVIAYTRTNAYAEFAENEKGTLRKGMLADLAVLSQDIFTVPVDQLTATRSLLTIVNGTIVYQEPGGIKVSK